VVTILPVRRGTDAALDAVTCRRRSSEGCRAMLS
jgi:hypothetical protein